MQSWKFKKIEEITLSLPLPEFHRFFNIFNFALKDFLSVLHCSIKRYIQRPIFIAPVSKGLFSTKAKAEGRFLLLWRIESFANEEKWIITALLHPEGEARVCNDTLIRPINNLNILESGCGVREYTIK